MKCFVGVKDLGGCSGFHRFGKDGVAVVVVKDQEVIVAGTRRCDESSGLVGVYLSGRFHDGGEAMMGAFEGQAGRWRQW